jgi:D-glycero-alpha-D-manno-heptose-7-phosphate kinase
LWELDDRFVGGAHTDGDFGPAGLARAAHSVETVELSRQSGVQDQVAAAHGGANVVSISAYPSFDVVPLQLPPGTLEALARRVVTVYLGAPHDSSSVHATVIEHLARCGREAETETDRLLAPLRTAAEHAAAALTAGDLGRYGAAMTACTRAQAALHPLVVSPLAWRVTEIAAVHGASGWKVNGAGGPGGSVSVLGADDPAGLAQALREVPGLAILALEPGAPGARVVDRD